MSVLAKNIGNDIAKNITSEVVENSQNKNTYEKLSWWLVERWTKVKKTKPNDSQIYTTVNSYLKVKRPNPE